MFGCFTKRLGQYTTKDLEGHSNHCFTENDVKIKVLLKCETMMFVWSRGGNVSIENITSKIFIYFGDFSK